MSKLVVYYVDHRGRNLVWDFMESLPTDDRKKCFEYVAYLQEVGEGVKRPIGDYLGDKLYELSPKQIRLLYFFILESHAVLVHAFRKTTHEIPKREMMIARKRMDDFILRYKHGQILLRRK